ncbi:hypothetical protein AAFF_G00228100 [Aldrovandia affinis]|uniref:G-patch domain-containing protein n=1 Tax=Aldrovandia affinis TaxID=143900 RepID=A0AAD7WV40_9TELE|nr:hypothetical protein AAFF_G00228100 [Aldrovandia affinis]
MHIIRLTSSKCSVESTRTFCVRRCLGATYPSIYLENQINLICRTSRYTRLKKNVLTNIRMNLTSDTRLYKCKVTDGTCIAVALRATQQQHRERQGHRLLKSAQEGDLSGLRALLEKGGCDVNFQDDYYWTAIMCASYAGQQGAVRLLLHKGAAWVGVVDTQGRDARDLANQAGHVEVVRELESFGVQSDTPGITSRSVSSYLPQWCLVCGVQHSEGEQKHHSSTLHQFSLQHPPPAPQYCLPSSSAGYRMMLQRGWGPGQGLGPSGAGCKRPIRTVLKRDQGGLGYGPTPQPRVTHFKAKDPLAVQWAPRARTERGATLGRRAERREEAKDRNWERDFRTSFNLPDF